MIQKVAVIGAGTMGNGIAQVFAMHHYDVILCDVSAAALANAMKIIEENLHRMARKELIQTDTIPKVLSKIQTTESDRIGCKRCRFSHRSGVRKSFCQSRNIP
jgi:3-hydroxybutyryl-CoA dehydrogenase